MTRIAKYGSIEQAQDSFLKVRSGQAATGGNGLSFQEILSQKTQDIPGLKFSRHASERLSSRSIELTGEIEERLNNGARRAEEKGIRDSLVVVDSYAFIVNIPNQTVVTAMDSAEADDHIFTNIDGAVIA